jgi:ABC-type glycerol-3-phosphate transport system substrate-binding protein
LTSTSQPRTGLSGLGSERSSRRAVHAGAAALAGNALAAACGGPSTSQPEAGGAATKGPQKVVFYAVFASGEPWDRYQAFWTNFTKENPNLQIEMRPGTGNYQTHREEILLEHVAGDTADFYDSGWGPWTDMADKGVVADIAKAAGTLFKRLVHADRASGAA